jgi:Family of unknown function (DUF6776)
MPNSRHLSARELRRQRNVLLAVGLLLLALVLLAGFYLGQRAAYSGMGMDIETYRAMEAEIPQLQAEIGRLQGEGEVQLTRHEVDRQALEMVRVEIAAQQEQISALEEGLRFYRSLMAPGEIAQGLSLRPVELLALDKPNRYAFRIVAQQEARKHTLLKGDLSIDVVGVLEGEQVSYSMAELSEDVEGSNVPLRFRYFQSIEGELEIPEGFEPGSVHLVATASTPRKAEVRVQFPWRLQERFTHVGK